MAEPDFAGPGRRDADDRRTHDLGAAMRIDDDRRALDVARRGRDRRARRHHLDGGLRRALGKNRCGPHWPHAERRLEGVETGFVDPFRHHADEAVRGVGRRAEAGLPDEEGAVVLSHRPEPHRRDVVDERDRRLEQAVGQLAVTVREGDELLAECRPVLEAEGADGPHCVCRLAGLDLACRDRGVPRPVAVEVAEQAPHRVRRRRDDGAPTDADDRVHRRPKRA